MADAGAQLFHHQLALSSAHDSQARKDCWCDEWSRLCGASGASTLRAAALLLQIGGKRQPCNRFHKWHVAHHNFGGYPSRELPSAAPLALFWEHRIGGALHLAPSSMAWGALLVSARRHMVMTISHLSRR